MRGDPVRFVAECVADCSRLRSFDRALHIAAACGNAALTEFLLQPVDLRGDLLWESGVAVGCVEIRSDL